MPKELEKGVALIITFFILTIILAVVLSISILLYNEIKIIRNIGNSVVAFYAADSGAEKVLYYDRQGILPGAVRGICNICNLCVAPDCTNCSATPIGDGCTKCTDCHISFETTMTQTPLKYYKVDVDVSPLPPVPQEICGLSGGSFQSYGTYMNTTRAIKLDITREVKTGLGPGMNNQQAIISNNGKITISVTLSPYPDCKKDSVTAYIYDQSGTLVVDPNNPLALTASGQCNYSKVWQGGIVGETYYISIGAFDANGYCASITVIPVPE